jgi:hypothetical protein
LLRELETVFHQTKAQLAILRGEETANAAPGN